MELLSLRRRDLIGDIERVIQALLNNVFSDSLSDRSKHDAARGTTTLTLVLWDDPVVIGHLAVFERLVDIGAEPLSVGMIGGVAIEPNHRMRGYARYLIQEAHSYLRNKSIPFSILFAYEPRVYQSSGYRLMENEIRFLDCDDHWKTFVYRGSMYAELMGRRWPNEQIDLRGRVV